MQEFKVNPLRLMASTQVRYDDLRLWLVTESVNSKPLSHYEILKVCNMLKIRLRVQLIVEEAEADNVIKSKYRYDRDRSEKVTEQNNSEVGQQLSKVTGVDVSSFGISGGIGEINSGGDSGGNQGEVSQGGEASVTGVEGIGGDDKGVQTWRSGNMATRYETEG